MSERVAPEVTDSPVPVGASLVADPAPLGLAAFATTTFVLSLTNANVWPADTAALGLALAYGGLAQLLAGMWEFRRGNTFGATAFASYGGFWISFFVFVFVVKPDNAQAVGTYLLAWAIFTAYMTIASTRVSAAIFAVFLLLTITYALLTVGAFEPAGATGPNGWTEAGGWLGVATAAAAWYASLAGVTNETFKRMVFPTGSVVRYFERV
jgi:succinate-acetate transporter protein